MKRASLQFSGDILIHKLNGPLRLCLKIHIIMKHHLEILSIQICSRISDCTHNTCYPSRKLFKSNKELYFKCLQFFKKLLWSNQRICNWCACSTNDVVAKLIQVFSVKKSEGRTLLGTLGIIGRIIFNIVNAIMNLRLS